MIADLIGDIFRRLWGRVSEASASTWLDRYYAQEQTPPNTKKELSKLTQAYDKLTASWLALDKSSRAAYQDDPAGAAKYYTQAAGKLTSRERALESAADSVYGRLAPGDRAAYAAVRQHYHKRLDAVHALAEAYKDPKRDFVDSQKAYEKDPRRFKAVSELKRVASVGKSMPEDATLTDYTEALGDYSETADLAEGLSSLQRKQEKEYETAQAGLVAKDYVRRPDKSARDVSLEEWLQAVLKNQEKIAARVEEVDLHVKDVEKRIDRVDKRTDGVYKRIGDIEEWQENRALALLDKENDLVLMRHELQHDQQQLAQQLGQRPAQKQPAQKQRQKQPAKQPKPSPELAKAYGEYAQLMLSVAGYKNKKKIDAIAGKFAGGEMTYGELRNRLQGGIYRRRMKESMGGRVAPPATYYTILSTAAYEEATKGVDDSGKDFQAWRDQMGSDGDAAKKYFDKQRALAQAKEAAEAQKGTPSHDAPSHEADNGAEIE